MKTIKHVMIDIETLSTEPNAVVLSIGALHFDPFTGDFNQNFYEELDTKDQNERHCSVDTVMWWVRKRVTKDVFEEGQHKTPVSLALNTLNRFFEGIISDGDELALWCCDPDFDLVILGNLYKQFGIKTPWRYYNGKSVRTIRMLNEDFGVSHEKQEASHNACEDCMRQAKEVIAFYQHNTGATITHE